MHFLPVFFFCSILLLHGNAKPVDSTENNIANELFEDIQSLESSGLIMSWPDAKVAATINHVSGVAFNNKGDRFVLHRGRRVWTSKSFNAEEHYTGNKTAPIPETTILVFDKNTKEKTPKIALGNDLLFLPHGISVDQDDNIWITDVALHQVLKFNKNSNQPSLVLGEKFVPGHDEKHFCKPTHVAVAKNGDFFVADGYCNSRIMKFDKSGKFLFSWGKSTNGDEEPAEDEFAIPHSLALIEDNDEICVADRENDRVQCFRAGLTDAKKVGEFTRSLDTSALGPSYAIAYNKKANTLAVLGGVRDEVTRSDVGIFNFNTGALLTLLQFPSQEGFGDGHTLAFSADGENLMVGSLGKVCPLNEELCDSEHGFFLKRNLWLYE